MGSVKDYFSSLGSGIASLVKGMTVTGKEFVTPKLTEKYPENRDTVHVPERFRAILELKYDDEGRHKCIACGICERNCPNGTISLSTKMVDTADGKKKRKLDKYMYDLGSCTFCQLCVSSCPQNAIEFSNDFEQAVFTREKLVKQLNYLPEKEEPAPSPEELARIQAEREAKIAAAKAAAAAKKAAAAAAEGIETAEKAAGEKPVTEQAAKSVAEKPAAPAADNSAAPAADEPAKPVEK